MVTHLWGIYYDGPTGIKSGPFEVEIDPDETMWDLENDCELNDDKNIFLFETEEEANNALVI